MTRLPHAVVIGGGLSGTSVVLHLLRDHPALQLQLTVIEPRPRLGAGLAYGTADPQHRINVAASRMALFGEDPLHFERWLHAHPDGIDSEARLPGGLIHPRRAVFGTYLADTLDQTLAAAGDRVRFRHARDRAASVVHEPGGMPGKTLVELADGGGAPIRADLLVLALGHAPPTALPFLQGLPPEQLVADPWQPGALDGIGADASVLVVGTGLTASDVFASLAGRGHRGSVLAVSRHGLLPRPRTTLPVAARGDFATAPAATALALLRRTRAEIRNGADRALPWEDVIDALRRDAPVAWHALPPGQKHRLLRHLRAFWDVHRFQCAPQVEAVTASLRRSGQLAVQAGRIERIGQHGDGRLRAEIQPRGGGPPRLHATDHVVNCTGPGHRSATLQHPVLAELARQELVRADDHGFGLEVDGNNHPLTAAGVPNRTLFVAGPMARSAHGELMGLPQVSTQPRAIAALIARKLTERLAAAHPPAARQG